MKALMGFLCWCLLSGVAFGEGEQVRAVMGMWVSPLPSVWIDDFNTNTSSQYTSIVGDGTVSIPEDGYAYSNAGVYKRGTVLYNTPMASADHTVEGHIGFVGNTSTSSGLVIRGNPGNATGYFCWLYPGNVMYFDKFAGSTNTAIGDGISVTLTVGVLYKFKIVASGNTFSFFADLNADGDYDDAGESLGQKTDATYAGTHVGMTWNRDGNAAKVGSLSGW